MQIEITVLIAMVGILLSVATFFFGRQSAARKEGEQAGKLDQKLENMSDDLKEIKAQVRDFSSVRTDLEVVKRDMKTAFNKIDELRTGRQMEIRP